MAGAGIAEAAGGAAANVFDGIHKNIQLIQMHAQLYNLYMEQMIIHSMYDFSKIIVYRIYAEIRCYCINYVMIFFNYTIQMQN